jgi:hypothetical protein
MHNSPPENNFSWHHPALYVANTTAGIGVFTNQRFRKNTMVALCGGFVMTLAEERTLPEKIRDLSHQIHDNFVIGPRHISQTGLTDRFNHSCAPNIGFQGQIALVTIKTVLPGQELTFDYAMAISGEPYELNCRCGNEHCRGIVTADDWKISRLQKNYKGYFQPYIEEKIARMAGRASR